VEVYSGTDRRWTIGWILAEDASGQTLSVLFNDESSAKLKYRPIGRRDHHLASVGMNIRRLPEHFELSPAEGADGPLLHRPTGNRCRTFEEAWALYFAVHIRHTVQHVVPFPAQAHSGGGITVRGSVAKAAPVAQCHPAQQLSVQPQPVASQSMAQGTAHDLARLQHMQQTLDELVQERARVSERAELAEGEVEELRSENERLRMELQGMRLKLEEARAQRDHASSDLLKAKHELKKLGGNCSFTADSFWQADEAFIDGSTVGANGSLVQAAQRAVSSAREKRRSEKVVEVLVTVPRARSHDDLEEEEHAALQPPPQPLSQPHSQPPAQPKAQPHAKAPVQPQTSPPRPLHGLCGQPWSLPSLVAGVTRMPSAPAPPVTVAVPAQRMTTLATHRASMAHHASQSAHIQTVQGAMLQQQQHPPVARASVAVTRLAPQTAFVNVAYPHR